MFAGLQKFISRNWILVGMISGILTGLIVNMYVDNPLIKDTILMNNVFYFGGNLFIRLMQMLVVPLVFSSIVVSLISISNMGKLGKIGRRAIVFYILLTVIALIIALGVTSIIQPGIGMKLADTGNARSIAANLTITDTILNIIPENPINALTSGEMLPIIIFGTLIGYIMVKLRREIHVADRIFKELNDIMMILTEAVMKFAPVGVFCMMARTFGTMGFENIFPLAKLIGCVAIGVGILIFIVYPIMIFVFTRLNPFKFLKKYVPVMLFAFSSASSSATIPLNIDTLEEIGVSRDISSFTIPLGTSLSQNGAAIIFGTGVLFAAQCHGIDLTTSSLLIISFIILLNTFSTPSVPMAGIFSLNIIFQSVGLPLAAIDLMMGIYNILDMFVTLGNVAGNGISTVLTIFLHKSRDESNYIIKLKHHFKKIQKIFIE